MRRYKIIISDPATGDVWMPSSFEGTNLDGASFTSSIGGSNLSAAWNIELDVFSQQFANPAGPSSVRVWGIALQDIWNASDLNHKNIEIWGGMAAGLPLATLQSGYYGRLIRGNIFPAYGNWISTEMTLDLIVIPGFITASGNATQQPFFGTNAQPVNLAFNWKKGSSLTQTLKTLFQTAFPGVTPNIQISGNLVAPQDLPFVYNTLGQLSSVLNAVSKSIVGFASYGGVQITYDPVQNMLNVTDGSFAAAPVQINIQDLIGQPTYLGPFGMQFKTPMRSDISPGTYVTMPVATQALAIANQVAARSAKNQSSFAGTYLVQLAHHSGNFREPSADAWVSIFNCVSVSSASSGTGGIGHA